MEITLKSYLSVIAAIVFMLPAGAQKVDTLYFDEKGDPAVHPAFADSYRIQISNNDGVTAFREFNTATKQLIKEGKFKLSTKPDSTVCSIFVGKYSEYYNNGYKAVIGYYNEEGQKEGDWLWYYENGNLHRCTSYNDGKENGLRVDYLENGKKHSEVTIKNYLANGKAIFYNYDSSENWAKAEGYYVNDKANGVWRNFGKNNELLLEVTFVNDKKTGPGLEIDYENGLYYSYTLKDGNYDKYIISTFDGYTIEYPKNSDTPLYKTATLDDVKHYKAEDGTNYQYYKMNGIMVAMTASHDKVYGEKYVRADIIVINGADFSGCTVDPTMMECHQVDGRQEHFDLFTARGFERDMAIAQSKSSFWYAVGNAIGSLGAGYTKTATDYYINGSYLGTVSTTSYSSTLAYLQNQAIREDNARFDAQLAADRQARGRGYLQKTFLEPGQVVSGYIMIEDTERKTVDINVVIKGCKYTFRWNTN